jgi:hypothetical protein
MSQGTSPDSTIAPGAGSDGRSTARRRPTFRHRRALFAWLSPVVAGGTVVVAAFCWAAYRAGSARGALAFLSGEPLYLSSARAIISGDGSDRAVVLVRNLTSHPLRIVGCNATCSCVTVGGVPTEVQPLKTHELSFVARSQVDTDVAVVLITDSPQRPTMRIDVKVTGARQLSGYGSNVSVH